MELLQDFTQEVNKNKKILGKEKNTADFKSHLITFAIVFEASRPLAVATFAVPPVGFPFLSLPYFRLEGLRVSVKAGLASQTQKSQSKYMQGNRLEKDPQCRAYEHLPSIFRKLRGFYPAKPLFGHWQFDRLCEFFKKTLLWQSLPLHSTRIFEWVRKKAVADVL